MDSLYRFNLQEMAMEHDVSYITAAEIARSHGARLVDQIGTPGIDLDSIEAARMIGQGRCVIGTIPKEKANTMRRAVEASRPRGFAANYYAKIHEGE